jgi:O-antigen/teichoic acid export membrane protein
MRSNFLRRFVQGGALSLVKLMTGLLKIKVLAAMLGVEGIGALSLGLQFQAMAVALVSMSLAVGVINVGRPLVVAHEPRRAATVLGTALSLVAGNAVVFLALLGVCTAWFEPAWMRTLSAHGSGVWPLAVAALLVSLANVMWEGLCFLLDRFDLYVLSNMVAAVFDMVLFVGLSWQGGLPGALWASLCSSLSLLLVYTLVLARLPQVRQILPHLAWDVTLLRPLVSYSALMLSTTAMGLVCLFAARAYLTAKAGEVANGYLQVVTALAAYLLPFVMTGVWGHLHPLASAEGDTPAVREEFRRTLLTSLRLGAAGCVAVVVGGSVLVPMVYTKDFSGALALMPAYFMGEIGFIFLSITGAYLLAVGNRRAYGLGYALYHGVLLLGVLMGAQRLGAWAYVLSHGAAAWLVVLVALSYAWRRRLIDWACLVVLFWCALAVGLVAVVAMRAGDLHIAGWALPWVWVAGAMLIGILTRPYQREMWRRLAP